MFERTATTRRTGRGRDVTGPPPLVALSLISRSLLAGLLLQSCCSVLYHCYSTNTKCTRSALCVPHGTQRCGPIPLCVVPPWSAPQRAHTQGRRWTCRKTKETAAAAIWALWRCGRCPIRTWARLASGPLRFGRCLCGSYRDGVLYVSLIFACSPLICELHPRTVIFIPHSLRTTVPQSCRFRRVPCFTDWTVDPSPCFHRFRRDLWLTISSPCNARETKQIWSPWCPPGKILIVLYLWHKLSNKLKN